MKLIVTKDQKPSFNFNVVFKKGETVIVEKEDSEMPGWYWCKNERGVSAWVPSEYLKLNGVNATLTTFYDSLELEVSAGTVLDYVTEVKYWTLCRKADGNEGWVRNENLRRIQ